jgi:CRISPR-associated protein Cmr2
MDERAKNIAWGIAYCVAHDRGFDGQKNEALQALIHDAGEHPADRALEELSLIAEATRLIATKDGIAAPMTREDLKQTRLYQVNEMLGSPAVALITGGATRIKQYVFESSKLPEIRGASALLDRINLYDVPSLFSDTPGWLSDVGDAELPESKELVSAVRQWFRNRYGVEPPNCKESLLYANGGELLAFAPTKIAEHLADAIEALYTKETLVADSVTAWRKCSLVELRYGIRPLEFWADDLSGEPALSDIISGYYGGTRSQDLISKKTFGEVVGALGSQRIKRRDGNQVDSRPVKSVVHFETVAYGRRCVSCESRNATIERTFDDEPDAGWFCEPCARKLAFGQKAKHEEEGRIKWFLHSGARWELRGAKSWASRFDDWLNENQDEKATYYKKTNASSALAPDDLDDIAKCSDGFIGIIYADGNNMGHALESLQTPSAYQDFAEAVYRATNESTFRAIARHLRPYKISAREKKRSGWLHPFEILSIGGDDVFLIVPGRAALAIAASIAEEAEAWLNRQASTRRATTYDWARVHRIKPGEQQPVNKSNIALSSGVVIADQHAPIFFLRRLVEELLKSAKAKARSLKQQARAAGGDFSGATIDFLVLKSVAMIATNIREFRQLGSKMHKVSLTAKPYTIPELKALINGVERLMEAQFPKTQLYRLREQLEKGLLPSMLEYMYAESRLRSHEDLREAVDRVWVGNMGDGHSRGFGLWLRTGDSEIGWETVLGDLAEIFDFTLKEEEPQV